MNKIVVLCLSVLLLSACNNTGSGDDENTTETSKATQQDLSISNGNIVLNAGDDMKFNLTEIRVKEGETIRLTLHHTGKAPKTAMGHNFVLLKAGVSLDGFVTKALEAKGNDYIPKDEADIIVHTKLIGGGESDSIEFVAPPKGSYPFLCSFPGHAMSMNGTLIVE